MAIDPDPRLEVMIFHATHGLKVVIARHLDPGVPGGGLPGFLRSTFLDWKLGSLNTKGFVNMSEMSGGP